MGLKRLTVVSKDSKTEFAGTTLFNSDYMEELQSDDSGALFYLRMGSDDRTPDKFIVSDSLGTATDTYDENSGDVYRILTVRDDANDSSSSTTAKVYDLRDIIKGIELPSDTTQSILWVEEADGAVKKILVDNFLKAIEDYWQTGTTTTYE